MYCDHCGADVDTEMKFCPKCGHPLRPAEPPLSRKRKLQLLLIPLAAAIAFVLVFLFVHQYLKHRASGEDTLSSAAQSEWSDGSAVDTLDTALDAQREQLLTSMQTEDLQISEGTASATVKLPCFGDSLLRAYEILEADGTISEETFPTRFLEELQKLLSDPQAETKQVDVSISVTEVAEDITGSAEYLETHDLTEAAEYTPSEEELAAALKQKALNQEIEWFELQLWSGQQLSAQELIPDSIQEANS